MIELAVLLNSRMTGLKTAVKSAWNGINDLGGCQRQRQGEVLRDQLTDDHREDGGQQNANDSAHARVPAPRSGRVPGEVREARS